MFVFVFCLVLFGLAHPEVKAVRACPFSFQAQAHPRINLDGPTPSSFNVQACEGAPPVARVRLPYSYCSP